MKIRSRRSTVATRVRGIVWSGHPALQLTGPSRGTVNLCLGVRRRGLPARTILSVTRCGATRSIGRTGVRQRRFASSRWPNVPALLLSESETASMQKNIWEIRVRFPRSPPRLRLDRAAWGNGGCVPFSCSRHGKDRSDRSRYASRPTPETPLPSWSSRWRR